jgi:two-component system chemotaxis sensor kinase CheA
MSLTPIIEAAFESETPLTLNIAEDSDLLREFMQEGAEHLQTIEQAALALEADPSNPETLNSIFRSFHTFKGGAGFLNLAPVHDLAHQLESLLDLARQKKLLIDRTIADAILAGGDCLRQFCNRINACLAAGACEEPIIVPTSGLLRNVRSIIASAANNEAIQPATVAATVAVPTMEASELAEVAKGADAATIKVNTQKLDGLVDAVGEMVIAQSLVVQSDALQNVQDEQLTRNLAQLRRITNDLQRTAMSLRMVPIRSTFQKMQRVVRDSAAKLGKQIELVTEGEDTELDRSIVEEISDPLVHMVRNSVDHGVEMPEARLDRGKSAVGTIRLRAFHQGGNIVIEIKDDGNGLNRDAILRKAIERQLIKADDELSDGEIFKLIFAAGFSTAERVTELSGRGVGMDVVRRNIEKLRGKIEIQSTPGEGATFSIYLPLTLAIIDGLLVGVGNHRYILPTLSVVESFRPAAGSIHTVQGKGEMVEARNRLYPLVRLSNLFGIEAIANEPENGIVVLVQSTRGARCILVDSLLGKQEVVIKTLGQAIQPCSYIAGAAILGDGRVGLILDSHSLVHLENHQAAGAQPIAEAA